MLYVMCVDVMLVMLVFVSIGRYFVGLVELVFFIVFSIVIVLLYVYGEYVCMFLLKCFLYLLV